MLPGNRKRSGEVPSIVVIEGDGESGSVPGREVEELFKGQNVPQVGQGSELKLEALCGHRRHDLLELGRADSVINEDQRFPGPCGPAVDEGFQRPPGEGETKAASAHRNELTHPGGTPGAVARLRRLLRSNPSISKLELGSSQFSLETRTLGRAFCRFAPMTIVHVLPEGVSPCSGAVPAILGLAVALAERGQKVEAWFFDEWPGRGDWSQAAVERRGVVAHQLPSGRGKDWKKAVARLRDADDVVVHLHNVLTPRNLFLARSLRAAGQSYVVSPHGTCAPEMAKRKRVLKSIYRLAAGRPMLAGALGVMALNEKEERDVRWYGFDGPVRRVANGVDLQRGDSPAEVEVAWREKLGVPAGARLALYAGRLEVDYKRLDQMVKAIAITSDWHLAFAGVDWGESRSTLESLAAELGVAERVTVLDPLYGDSLWSLYREADLLMLLSRSEGLSMSLLEALACGTPALVSPTVALTIDLGDAGWVSPPEAAGGMLERLSALTPLDWAGRREKARALAASYGWHQVAEDYEQALGEFLHDG